MTPAIAVALADLAASTVFAVIVTPSRRSAMSGTTDTRPVPLTLMVRGGLASDIGPPEVVRCWQHD